MNVSTLRTTFPAVAAALALGCATTEAAKEQPKEAAPQAAAAPTAAAPAAAPALPSYKDSRTETATATVVSVDQKTRRVVLKDKDGKNFTFIAGPDVRNLAQVAAGDLVKVTYTESLAIQVKRGDGSAPDASVGTAVDRAAPGEKPAGAVAEVITVSADIVAIDRQTNRVTLRGPEGNYRVVQVREPKNLENVKVGDKVYATYTESLGIAVEKVPAAK